MMIKEQELELRLKNFRLRQRRLASHRPEVGAIYLRPRKIRQDDKVISLARGGGGRPSAIWIPKDIPGLVAEFYSEFVVKDGGNLVSQLTDQSGQGNHGTRTTDADKPLWVDAQLNGYPAIRFDGLDDSFLCPAPSSTWAGVNAPFSVFAVLKRHTNAINTMVVGANDGGGSKAIQVYMGPATPPMKLAKN